MERKVTIGRSAAVLSVLMLATGPSIVKISDLPEMTFIFWRLAAAALGYAVALRFSGKHFSWEAWRRSLLGGLVFGVNLVFFVLSMRRTSAANAVMIGALQPVVLIGIAGPFFGERPRRSIYLWSLVAMGGVALSMVASSGDGVASRTGNLLALAGMLLFSAYFVVSKKARQVLDSMTYQLGLTLTAVLVVIPFAF
jgi:EamA-like transporter family.